MAQITEEQMKMLQGLTSFSPAATTWYVAESHLELPEEIRPRIKLRPLRQAEISSIKKIIANIDKVKDEELREYARICILSWEQWYDAGTGELVEFKLGPDGSMDKDLFLLIPVDIVADIIRHILKISGLMTIERAGL
jgi:hypothetical protein